MTAPTAERVLAVPALALVVLVGASGSGKSTFAARHFGRFEVISSDFCRGLVADDENDQGASADAFAVLHYIAGKRLAAGRLTVVDATNVQREARRQLVELARAHDVLPVAIVLDPPEAVAVARNRARPDRDFGDGVVRRQRDQLRRSLRGLQREGFRTVHVLRSVEEVDAARVIREPLRSDLREVHGPFDVIGDVHGCLSELLSLLDALGYRVLRDEQDRPVDAAHPDGRTVVFLGDLVDRGPDSVGVLRLAMGMTAAGHAMAVPGNHEHKLVRALGGRDVRRSHGLAQTMAQLDGEGEDFRDRVARWADALVAHLVLDDGRLVVAHAGLKEAYHNRASGRVRSFALYGDTTGESDEYGLPVRLPWAREYRGRAMVLYGHVPTPEPEWVNNTLCLDTGCAFGGHLTALRYPEREIIQVPAERVWYQPVRPFPVARASDGADRGGAVDGGVAGGGDGPGDGGPAGQARPGDELDLEDVLGARSVTTRHHGRVSVRAENAAGALEVMSRFALPPRWVPYLPPTMSPVATSARAELLEHPEEAFAWYASAGVAEVVCEEKHMGSRAVVVLCRDQRAATRTFGAPDGETGAVYTRTGRSFLDPERTEELLGRLRTAATTAGLWQELGTDWLVLDTELLPWSVKAEGLLRAQYAAVGAAARAVMPAAVDALAATASRGVDVAGLLTRTGERAADAGAFAAAYRRYCWPVHGLDGLQVAPFQVLAAAGATFEERPHTWHLALADRLVAADPALVRPTRHLSVLTGDAGSVGQGVAWWEELTAAGGEGMVVKPEANLARSARGLVQPGLKVRGREYLRLIYGPDYTRPENLSRLRDRKLGLKRSLALREYALGLESLARLADGEPLWRVHEAVFAVLACESEPVDPRL